MSNQMLTDEQRRDIVRYRIENAQKVFKNPQKTKFTIGSLLFRGV